MLQGLLPIGSVVMLKEGLPGRKFMIIGVVQEEANSGKLWDYAGVFFPEGYIGSDRVFLFNGDNIDRIFFIGYQDKEQFAFKEKAEALLKELRDREK